MGQHMNTRKVVVTEPKEKGSGHTRISYWGGDRFYDRFFCFDARRVVCEGNDEAQIEVQVSQTLTGGKHRTTTIYGSVVLSPEEARSLALAICPELAPK